MSDINILGRDKPMHGMPLVTFNDNDGKKILWIEQDGTVRYSDPSKLDESAKLFWDAIKSSYDRMAMASMIDTYPLLAKITNPDTLRRIAKEALERADELEEADKK